MASESKSTGIGATSLLGVAFIVLKLTGTITWSWWWVLAPFWGGVALVLFIFALYLLIKVAIR